MASPLLWRSSCDPNIMPLVAVDPLKTTNLYYNKINLNSCHKLFPMCSDVCACECVCACVPRERERERECVFKVISLEVV
jgi:hypothetical protein